jgi:hypothetical protein
MRLYHKARYHLSKVKLAAIVNFNFNKGILKIPLFLTKYCGLSYEL